MSEKKKYHIALLPEIHRQLRILAAEKNQSIGDVIEELVKNLQSA